MSEKLYKIALLEWYAVPDGMGCIDWDCDSRTFFVKESGVVGIRDDNSLAAKAALALEFPDAISLDGTLSRHRNKWERTTLLNQLKTEYPKIWEVIEPWFASEDELQLTATESVA